LTQPGWGLGNTPAATPRRRPVADIFDEAFRLYRQNFALMVVVFGVFQVPLVLLTLPFWAAQAQWQAPSAFDPARLPSMDELGWLGAGAVAITIAGMLLGTFAGAAIAYVVSRARTGDRPAVGQVFQALRRQAGQLLGLVLLLVVGLLALGLIVAVVVVAGGGLGGGGAAIGAALLAAIVASVVIAAASARLTLAVPALVVERSGPLNALRRSWALVEGSTLRTFAILLLGGLVVGLISSLFSPLFLPGIAEGLVTGSVVTYAIVGLGSGIAQVLLGPIVPTVVTILYFDYVDRERARESRA